MINKIKYYTRNFIIYVLTLPSVIIAIIRFKLSYIKHKNDPDVGVGLLLDDLNVGGLENIVMSLYKGYRQNKNNSYLIIVNNNVSNYIKSLEDDPRQFQILFCSRARLLNYCRVHKIYTMHYHFSTFSLRLLSFLGVKTIYTIHNTYVWFTPRMWRRLKRSLKKCTYIVAVSDFAKNYFEEKTKITRTITINNGIDINGIQQSMSSSHDMTYFYKECGFKKTDKIVAMLSSFSEQKYHLSLIGAMEKAFEKHLCDPKTTKILMCGPILDKKIYSATKRAIKKSPYSDNFILHEPIDSKDIGAFLQNIPNLIVLPSLYEGGVPPLIITESLICNKPVVMTDLDISNGPFAEYIQTVPRAYENLTDLDDKKISKIVYSKNSQNQEALALKISEVLSNLKEYIPNIPESKLHLLDTETMVKKYLELISK